ncbi:MAG: hypothetical protein KDA45_03500 [Planctomycetales bacterium]|nr:hypothetical protein [Planctomycetales bacterium]
MGKGHRGGRPGRLHVQFGHNDHYKENGQHLVSTADYKKNLGNYVQQVRDQGATPILVTPMCRRIFGENGKIKKSFDDYPNMVLELAQETHTDLIDLYEISFQEFGKMSQEETKDFFLYLLPNKYPAFPEGKKDGVHFQLNGARQLAGWVVKDATRQQLTVAALFR